ncbi:MAG: hypothetical protein JSR66_19665 [Proteobacteria bacterium]|nr:hypothetical protein [Pseudomonadota bacterium]
MSVSQLELKAAQFQRQARVGDFVEYFGCALVVLSFGSFLWTAVDLLTRIGSLAMILVTLVAGFQLRKHKAQSLPSIDRVASSLLDFHRAELARRKHLLERSWQLVTGPLVLGLLVFTACLASRGPSHVTAPFVLCGITAAMGVVMTIHNRLQAKRLQREIDELK